ncbi:type I-C CRISPR-associated protein Cas8c/Csd1 [Clostridium sp. Marseille-P299]|uniref:type I-C CRISPR-associated protein Cas8c/Csd1 n=1 Tax=Clostridium sp. Marseille-P299 TaxID=1805477 RepID=UPI000832CABD|nr:type I-C CRISPR-associated protein Cas8c/Csd1 [Clostridium sp. Marseille-P299]
MLLQSLVKYYEILSEDEDYNIPQQGFGNVKVSFALNISKEGELLNMVPLKVPSKTTKKLVAQNMIVPEPVTRSSGVSPNFLCDNSSYVFGFDNKGKPKRSIECFEAFKKLHMDILGNVDCIEARAVINFLNNWDVRYSVDNGIVREYLDDIYGGANFVFIVDNMSHYVHQNEEIKRAWMKYKNSTESVIKNCLVTGKKSAIARLHPIIKGINGGQAMGNSLVSFNAKAYESYGNEDSQGFNSPVSEYAAFAYGTVLNHLLEDKAHRLTIGDSTVVYWAESPKSIFQDMMSFMLEPHSKEKIDSDDEEYIVDLSAAKEVRGILERISEGKKIDIDSLCIDKNVQFYILGLSPNAARISVRFFIQNSFGKVTENIIKHYENLAIEKQYESDKNWLSIWGILNETVSPNSRDKSASPLLSGSVMRAILEGSSYPTELFHAVMIRIRAEGNINYNKAGIIKAYLTRCKNYNKYKEVLTLSLNNESTNKAYVLGRLFAILEKVQQDANPGINTTIKDRYFTSACATPANVFPILLKLSNHHISKAEYGKNSENRIRGVMDLLSVNENPFPKQLPLEEQGIFVLGYYHQKNAFYKKEEA